MVFGLFSKEKSITRAIEITTNIYRQSADRYAAMEKLKKEDSDEAWFGLCRRFSVTSDHSIEDQQEKQWVIDQLAEKGTAALPALRRYMKSSVGLGLPLVALTRIADSKTVLEVVDELLASEEPGYTRDPKKRIDVIEWLSEWTAFDAETLGKRIVPYLADFDEVVRFKSVEALFEKPTREAIPGLLAALVRPEEESKRLRVRIAELLAEQKWPVADYGDKIAPLLGNELSGFALDKGLLVKK